jgi:tripartite-type tricarboxylate transporter receptor subunit TctC
MSFDCGVRRIGALALTAAIALAVHAPVSHAQRKAGDTAAYPTRPVRAIVPYAPGGGTDIMARALAQKLSAQWGQQVVVDNRGGGATIVGTDLAAKSPPDGYTLLITSTSFVINPTVQPRLPYDTLKDFQPVTQLAFQPYVLVLHPSVPARDVKELVALSKAKPNALSFGSTGTGSGAHLAGELFKMTTGAQMTHIPYRGMGPALADLLGAQTQAVFGTILPTLPHVKSGRLRALGVTSAKRSSALPDLPTIAEAGAPGYSATSWTGLYTPAGVPGDIARKIHDDALRALQSGDMRDKLAADGAEPAGGSSAELAALVRQEIAKWGKVIKAAHIQIQ